jgi:hypothetical protein
LIAAEHQEYTDWILNADPVGGLFSFGDKWFNAPVLQLWTVEHGRIEENSSKKTAQSKRPGMRRELRNP